MDDDMDFVTDLMAQRDDLNVPDDVAARIKGKRNSWAYMQGYIEAFCEIEGLDLAEAEAVYQEMMRVAAGTWPKRGTKIAAKREP